MTLTEQKVAHLQAIQDRMIGRTRRLEAILAELAVLNTEMDTLRAEHAIDARLMDSIEW